MIPQGAFDLDPIGFTEKYLSKDFEYVGSEIRSHKKGGKEDFHKIKVKYELIKFLVEEYASKDPAYIPKSGEILNYVKFFSAYVCKSFNAKKNAKEILKEINSIARKNSYLQIKAMEQTGLVNCERSIEEEKVELEAKKKDLDLKVSSLTSLADLDSYELLKQTYEFKSKELASKLIVKRSEIVSYYEEVRAEKDRLEVKLAAVKTNRNEKRRAKRVVEKVSRMRVNNDLEVLSENGNSNPPSLSDSVDSSVVEEGNSGDHVDISASDQSVSSTGYEE